MKFIIIFILCLHSNLLVAQSNDPTIENGQPYDKEYADSILHDLHNENDYVITFKIKSYWKGKQDYFILAKHGDTIISYKYIVQKFEHLARLNLPKDSANALWQTCITNDLFKIKDSRNVPDNCPKDSIIKNGKAYYHSKVSIEDSYFYEFNIFSKSEMKKLSYSAPEFFENNCGSVIERKKIINCASAIKQLIK